MQDDLTRLPIVAHAQASWPWHEGLLELEIHSMLMQPDWQLEPPLERLITSVRGIVTRHDDILVITDPVSDHILPGGRRQPGETLRETLVREVREETGWIIKPAPGPIGLIRFHFLSECPPDYPYPYPDFLQIVFRAEAERLHPDGPEEDGYEVGARFVPRVKINTVQLQPGERKFLRAIFDPTDRRKGKDTQ